MRRRLWRRLLRASLRCQLPGTPRATRGFGSDVRRLTPQEPAEGPLWSRRPHVHTPWRTASARLQQLATPSHAIGLVTRALHRCASPLRPHARCHLDANPLSPHSIDRGLKRASLPCLRSKPPPCVTLLPYNPLPIRSCHYRWRNISLLSNASQGFASTDAVSLGSTFLRSGAEGSAVFKHNARPVSPSSRRCRPLRPPTFTETPYPACIHACKQVQVRVHERQYACRHLQCFNASLLLADEGGQTLQSKP